MAVKKKVRTHLITDGDSLFGAKEVACQRPLSEIQGEEGVFGQDDMSLRRVTCRRCQASVEYRAKCYARGMTHPFSKAAMKAHETIRKQREAASNES